MSFEDLLIHLCDISRYTTGAVDDYGNPVKSWSTILTNEPCRLTSGGGKEITVGLQVVVANYRLFIGDVDITEQDRVVIDTVTYEVLLVERFSDATESHHKQCYLQAVR